MTDPDPKNWPANAAPSTDPRPRAALLTWVLSGIQLLAFGCCTLSGVVALFMPTEHIEQAIRDAPFSVRATADQMYTTGLLIAVIGFVLGIMPAVFYLVAGFSVRRGHKLMTSFAMLLIVTQLVVFGTILLVAIAEAIAGGVPAVITVYVLTLGTLVAILVATLRALLAVKHYDLDVTGEDTDPWNDMP